MSFLVHSALYDRKRFYNDAHFYHRLLALIASATDRALARYVGYVEEENRILRNRIPGEIHTKPHERARLLKFENHLDMPSTS